MSRDLNHIIGSGHDIKVTILIKVTCVSCLIITRKLVQISILKPSIVVPKRSHKSWRHGQFDNHVTQDLSILKLLTLIIKDSNIITRKAFSTRTSFSFESFRVHKVGCNKPTCFGLPISVIIETVLWNQFLKVLVSVDVGSLSDNTNNLKGTQIKLLDYLLLWILLSYWSNCSWRSVKDIHFKSLDNLKVSTAVWSSNRFPFVNDTGGSSNQRSINNVGMTNNPTEIRTGKNHMVFFKTKPKLKRSVHSNCSVTMGPVNSLGLASCTWGIQNIQRKVRLQNNSRLSRILSNHLIPNKFVFL